MANYSVHITIGKKYIENLDRKIENKGNILP